MLLYFVVVSFFFFFKQKTAYEMRISDWSSDVCSSDLRTFCSGIPAREGWGFLPFCRVAGVHAASPCNIVEHFSRNVARRRLDRAPSVRRRNRCGPWPLRRSDTKRRYAESGQSEIGRASCRERVGQYV